MYIYIYVCVCVYVYAIKKKTVYLIDPRSYVLFSGQKIGENQIRPPHRMGWVHPGGGLQRSFLDTPWTCRPVPIKSTNPNPPTRRGWPIPLYQHTGIRAHTPTPWRAYPLPMDSHTNRNVYKCPELQSRWSWHHLMVLARPVNLCACAYPLDRHTHCPYTYINRNIHMIFFKI